MLQRSSSDMKHWHTEMANRPSFFKYQKKKRILWDMKAFLTILLASEPPVQDRECAALLCLSPGAAASWLQPSCRVACVQR